MASNKHGQCKATVTHRLQRAAGHVPCIYPMCILPHAHVSPFCVPCRLRVQMSKYFCINKSPSFTYENDTFSFCRLHHTFGSLVLVMVCPIKINSFAPIHKININIGWSLRPMPTTARVLYLNQMIAMINHIT